MRFSLATKPLKDALNLIVINSNVSNFNLRSEIIQLEVEGNELRMNTEATSIYSEVYITGNNEDGQTAFCTLDCLTLKNLISSISEIELTLDFTENSLDVITSKSKFSIPKKLSDVDIRLNRPTDTISDDDMVCEIDSEFWKFIKKNQLYALCTIAAYQVFNFVWMDKRGVITGDPNVGYFTYLNESEIEDKCLMSVDIINLLASFDDGSKLYKTENGYIVKVDRDSFSLTSQFIVFHEGVDGIDHYGEAIVFDMLLDESDIRIDLDLDEVTPFIKQTMLLSSNAVEENILFHLVEGELIMSTDSTEYRVDASDSASQDDEFSCTFKLQNLYNVLSHMDRDVVKINPIVKEGMVYGLKLEGNRLTSLIGGIDDGV